MTYDEFLKEAREYLKGNGMKDRAITAFLKSYESYVKEAYDLVKSGDDNIDSQLWGLYMEAWDFEFEGHYC